MIMCGDRHWGKEGQSDWDKIRQVLLDKKPYKIIEGEARGADKMSRAVAEQMGIYVDCMPADWERYGRSAGPIRNRKMLERLIWYRDEHDHKILVVAFHSNLNASKGTANMVMIAQKAGVEVEVVI